MNRSGKKWMLAGIVFLAASFLVFAEERSAGRGSSPHRSAGQSAASKTSQTRSQPPSQSRQSARPSAVSQPSAHSASPARPSYSNTSSRTVRTQTTASQSNSPTTGVRRSSSSALSRPVVRQSSTAASLKTNRQAANTNTAVSAPTTKQTSSASAARSSAAGSRSAGRLSTQRRVYVLSPHSRQEQKHTQSADTSVANKSTSDKTQPAQTDTARTAAPSRHSLTAPQHDSTTRIALRTDASKTDSTSPRSRRETIVSRIDSPSPSAGRSKSQEQTRHLRTPSANTSENSLTRASALAASSDRTHRDLSARSSARRSHADRYDSRIHVTSDNKLEVVGRITPHRPRPYIPRRLYHDTAIVHRNSAWHRCGSHFALTFSWNSCARLAYVPYGSCYGFTYYYPHYHRRYVFVSIGGWWPCEYRYRRYYWYGCHPYYWYGATVITPPAVVEQNTYNTYNYYTAAPADQQQTEAWKYPFGDPNYDVSDYIQRISADDAPEFETAADLCFAHGVDLFLAGKYAEAAAQFREAVRVSPEDIILPFTYSQALFADSDYAHAAAVLRAALAAIPEDQLTIYYPRGLYEKEETLTEQIEALEKAVQNEPFAADYHLLLGYQYLGLGRLDKAAAHLTEAAKDTANQHAAEKLLELTRQLQETPEEE
ncbi:MAG TPA: hypothetical protein PLX18_09285 [Anaerohalosphaeraceae bacterium]|nr:hypothetical protein [Anaerohalosphaeraceae bacterium]HQG06576.1 hypothetical protein [Anaerohalosphaeraceae bacterium]HQI08030.1 hypothetical protein [Anaerohalosphaeraceae bacterium]HQJ68331.1 hypothetical protein [Anaerohalosphaeraceae bacterium]